MSNLDKLKELANTVDFWGHPSGWTPEDLHETIQFALKQSERLEAAEAELARRDAAAGEPVPLTVEYSQFLTDILTASGLIYHGKKDKALSERLSSFCVAERNKFTAAQPAALPKEIPAAFYKVLYDECGGFVDCTADAAKIWAAFRKLAQGFTVEGDSDE